MQSCGVGVTITRATRCVLLDPCWNRSVEEQAISRCHRIGQERPVHVYRFSVAATVEVEILKLSKAKGDFGDMCLARRDNRRGPGGLQDILRLFGANA